ncbi:hypothetical protein [Pseudoxanthomonas beigongshangi]
MITQPNLRRHFTNHAPLPAPVNPLLACTHRTGYCSQCLTEGTVIHNNHDIESSSWVDVEPTPQTATLQAFFIAGLFAFGLGIHAKHESNPSHFQAKHPASSAASRG